MRAVGEDVDLIKRTFKLEGDKLFRFKFGEWVEYTGKWIREGYLLIGVGKRACSVHRVIWVLAHGAIPDGYEVDHINNIRTDNRLENLQLLSYGENNRKRFSNRELPVGVRRTNSGKYSATVEIKAPERKRGYKSKSLGTFETIEEAKLAVQDYFISRDGRCLF